MHACCRLVKRGMVQNQISLVSLKTKQDCDKWIARKHNDFAAIGKIIIIITVSYAF